MEAVTVYRNLREKIDKIPVVDSHEHIYMTEEEHLAHPFDFYRFFWCYIGDDLVSAGMDAELVEDFKLSIGHPRTGYREGISIDEKWKSIAPWWKYVCHTGYGQAVRRSIKKFTGFEILDESNYHEISERLDEWRKEGIYKRIFTEICGVEKAINCFCYYEYHEHFKELDKRFFTHILHTEDFLFLNDEVRRQQLFQYYNADIRNLDDLVDMITRYVSEAKSEGFAGIKIGVAYMRDLSFEDVTSVEAERVLRRIFQFDGSPSLLELKPLTDFLLHRFVDAARKYELVITIHTGHQAGGPNVITNSRASQLLNLFIKNPDVRFDIFHISYPYWRELGSIVKQFPNVAVNMCWAHSISPIGARNALSEWLEMLPANKIIGFGGDIGMPEQLWGHLDIARENIARVLTKKIVLGVYSEEDALDTAHRLLNDNPREWYRLSNK